ncbi:MAG TPA: TetR/AcrR family transcriptional regulator [Candidatus Aquicultor sp.]|jgi:AcrR family transcriptional regulator
MARTKKSPEHWRSDLLAAAQRLFAENGVARTSVGAIAKAAGAAAGTFYLYFDSKEDLIRELAKNMAQKYCEAVSVIAKTPGLGAVEKLFKILEISFISLDQRDVMDHFHKEHSKLVHFLLVEEVAQRLNPAFEEIISQGVSEGVFTTQYPKESAAFVIAAANAIPDVHVLTKDEINQWKEALLEFSLTALGCEATTILDMKRSPR